MLGVGDDTADGLRVADVTVGAHRRGDGVAGLGAAAQLVDRARLDVAADGDRDVRHAVIVASAGARGDRGSTAPGRGFEPTRAATGAPAGARKNLPLRPAGTCFTVGAVMLSQAHTTMLLTHGALSAGFVSCRPIDEPAQRTNYVADAA